MQFIGLTGGIAAGKSLVARRFRELGAVVIDADALARDAVEPGTPGLAAVVDEFGPGVLRPDGALDREALGRIVFGDDERRARLGELLHPQIGRLAERAIAAAVDADPDAIVVYDIPLLAESIDRVPYRFDAIVVVEADEATRVARMVRDRGMTEEDARARIAAQATEAERRAIADHLIVNEGDVDAALAEVDAVWRALTAG